MRADVRVPGHQVREGLPETFGRLEPLVQDSYDTPFGPMRHPFDFYQGNMWKWSRSAVSFR